MAHSVKASTATVDSSEREQGAPVPLTGRQLMALNFIRSHIEARGYPPTLREIGENMGIRSTNGVNDHLRALERKGYLRKADGAARAIRLTGVPCNDSVPPPPRAPSAPRSPDLEPVPLECLDCRSSHVEYLEAKRSLRSQLPTVACRCCGVVGEMVRKTR